MASDRRWRQCAGDLAISSRKRQAIWEGLRVPYYSQAWMVSGDTPRSLAMTAWLTLSARRILRI